MSTTVRVSARTHDRVAAIAQASGRQIQHIVDDAVTAYERELFFSRLADGYAALADDEQAWADVQSERAAEAPALADDLPGDEPVTTG